MIKEAYEAGVKQALIDAGLVKESSVLRNALLGGGLGAGLGAGSGYLSTSQSGDAAGNALKGALIGGGVGAFAGAGHAGMKQVREARELKKYDKVFDELRRRGGGKVRFNLENGVPTNAKYGHYVDAGLVKGAGSADLLKYLGVGAAGGGILGGVAGGDLQSTLKGALAGGAAGAGAHYGKGLLTSGGEYNKRMLSGLFETPKATLREHKLRELLGGIGGGAAAGAAGLGLGAVVD